MFYALLYKSRIYKIYNILQISRKLERLTGLLRFLENDRQFEVMSCSSLRIGHRTCSNSSNRREQAA